MFSINNQYENVLTLFKAAGTASPSFTASLVEDYLSRDSLTREVEEDIKGAAGVLYGGTLSYCILHGTSL